VHTDFRLVPESTTLDDLERPLRTPLQKHASFRAYNENLNKDRPMHTIGSRDVAQ